MQGSNQTLVDVSEVVIPDYHREINIYQDEMIAKDWQELGEWESELRQEYHRRKGWNGKLRELEVTP